MHPNFIYFGLEVVSTKAGTLGAKYIVEYYLGTWTLGDRYAKLESHGDQESNLLGPVVQGRIVPVLGNHS